jgi:manganese/zinc/iron transport system permease protein
VVAFFVTHDISSPLLIIGAALTGILTVALVELINRTGLLKEDASIGLVFPVLFSIGIILISKYAGNVHLDTDAVLLGELAFSPFNRLKLGGIDLGPVAVYVMSIALILNILFITLFYKELKISTFDPGLAASLGIVPAIMHYSHMTLVSITAVAAFDVVGSILVVALMIGPAASAYLLTDRLPLMIFYSALIGIGSAISGYWLAHGFDVSIAGSMATMTGVAFLLTFIFAPGRGLVSRLYLQHKQKFEFAAGMLAVHLLNHEGTESEISESEIDHLEDHFKWDSRFSSLVLKFGERHKMFIIEQQRLVLTDRGKNYAREVMVE